jgi:hypothetical protein
MTPLFDFLNGFWGPFAIIALGFLLMGKAIYDRWPDPQTETASEPESQEPKTDTTQSARQSGSRNVQIQGEMVNFQGTISTGEEEVSTARLSDGRIVVDTTPEYLAGFFDEHTSIQAEKLVEAFIGKWIRLSGPLENVAARSKDEVTVFFTSETFGDIMPVMVFNDRLTIENLRVLKRGNQITVVGQIQRVSSMDLKLENCELEKP